MQHILCCPNSDLWSDKSFLCRLTIDELNKYSTEFSFNQMRSVGIAQHPLDFDQEIVSYQIGISSENTNNKECSPEKQ